MNAEPHGEVRRSDSCAEHRTIDADDDSDRVLSMDCDAADETFDEGYRAKCGSHPRPRWRGCRAEEDDEDLELSESDRKRVEAAIGSVHPDNVQGSILPNSVSAEKIFG
jgi:hypothetical protein